MQRRIRVSVKPATFPSERAVSFEVAGRRYSLIVDERDIRDDTLAVSVVAENQEKGEAVIDLPRDTPVSGSRIRIPSEALLPA